MGIVLGLVLCWAIFHHSIELSFQYEHSSDGDSPPRVPRGRPSLDLSLSLALSSSSTVRSSPRRDSHLLDRSRSPPKIYPHYRLGGHTIEELSTIQLIPHSNPNQRFEIRDYTFPRDVVIHVREQFKVLRPIANEKHTVLLTQNGDVLAILGNNKTILRGMYRKEGRAAKRTKINIYNGRVEEMTPAEIEQFPLGKDNPISKNFKMMKLDRAD